MKRMKGLYIAFIVLGLCFAAASLIFWEEIPYSLGTMLMCSGSGMVAIGLTQLLMLRLNTKDPAQARRKEIEVNDERNVAIRRRAKALSGDALQWVVMVAAWVSLACNAPLWVTLGMTAVFVLKSVLEVYLAARYQREM